MLSLHRTLTANYVGQHPTRTALVVVSITLGVAVLVATQSLNRGLRATAEKSVNPLSTLADLLINNGQAGVSADLARELREAHLEGIESASAGIMVRVALSDQHNELNNRSVWFFGMELPESNQQQGKFENLGQDYGVKEVKTTFKGNILQEILAGRAFAFIDDKLSADLARLKPTDPSHFKLRIAGKQPELTVMGTVSFDTEKLPLNDSVVVVDITSASALAYPTDPGKVQQINVKVKEGSDRAKVREALTDWLKDRGQVQSIEASHALVSDVTAGLELGFALGGAGALVVGLFLVYNALSVSVAERRHDIGILRSVGATRGQIAGLFVAEAAGMGLLGSLLGLPLGIGLAWLAIQPLSKVVSDLLVPLENARIDVSPQLMIAALLAGTLVAILAALVPALQAAGEEPADAVRRVPRRQMVMFVIVQIGGSCLLIGMGLLFVQFRSILPHRLGVFAGIVCLLLGALVSTPLFAAIIGRVIQPLFRYFLGIEGRLAADNLVRSPGRTGLVIAALAATIGLMVQTAGFLRSSEEAIYTWVEEKIAADLFVTSGSAVTSGGFALSMDEKLRDGLLQMKDRGVQAVLPARFHRVDFRDHIVFLVALDINAFDQGGQDRVLARTLARYPRLRSRGTCLVSENFGALHNIKPGDTFEISDRAGKPLPLEVLGTVVDYTWNRGTILIDRSWFRQEFADQQIDVMDVYLAPGTDVEAIRKEIQDRWSEKEALITITRPELHEEVRGQLKRVYSMAYAQQMVVGLVALLGVVSALFISVLQRRRELGLLRAVGATRAQILRSVLAEAILMGLIGVGVGCGIGLMLEWYVLDIMLIDEAGFTFPMRIPWIEAGVVSLAAVLCASLAGLLPAYQATQLRIPEAIAYE